MHMHGRGAQSHRPPNRCASGPSSMGQRLPLTRQHDGQASDKAGFIGTSVTDVRITLGVAQATGAGKGRTCGSHRGLALPEAVVVQTHLRM